MTQSGQNLDAPISDLMSIPRCTIPRNKTSKYYLEMEGEHQLLVAKYPYTAKRADELSFEKKDALALVSRLDDKGWWRVRDKEGREGLVPATYVVPLARPADPGAAQSEPKTTPEEKEKEKEKEEAREDEGADEGESEAECRARTAERRLASLVRVVEEDRIETDALVAELTQVCRV